MDSLKDSLFKLECHFTWGLFDEGLDIDNIEERLYEQIIFTHYGNKHRIYNLLAYLKHLKGDNEEAILQLKIAEDLIQETDSLEDVDVQRIVTYGNYAWVFYQQKQIMESSTYVKKVENILKKFNSSSMQSILQLEIYSEKGWTYLTYPGKWYEKAVEYFKMALELDPESPELNSGYAIVVYRMECMKFGENQANTSISLLKRAVQLNPKDTVVKTLLALKYHELKTYELVDELKNEALRDGSESPFVLKYVAKLYRRRNMDYDAIAMLKKALHLTPKSASLHYQLGVCYKKFLKNLKQSAKYNSQPLYSPQQKAEALSNAIFHLKKAVELKTTFVHANILLAEVYVQARQYQKAEETFKKTLSMKYISCLQKQELHYSWACYERFAQKSESKAIWHLREVIMIKNQSYFREKSVKDLKCIAENMLAQKSVNPTGYGLLAFIYQEDSQDKLATEYYEKALQVEPNNQEYLAALATLQTKCSCLSVN